MTCGIHQGGYLSLLKYVAFINSLLVELKESKLCCPLYKIPSSPLGYADDIAAASISKHNTEQVLNIVYAHSCKWRYDLNAKKSAIVVYGESPHENKRNKQYRSYNLGPNKVSEKVSYDHVGVKTCNGMNYIERTDDKISKARKALSAASALGIKKGGLSIRACNIIYWCLIVPILTYGAELWVLHQNDIEALEMFQRYAGRRIQRFPSRTPNETSFRGLGWMRLENYINAKKMIFVRTILIRENTCIYKKMFITRAHSFNEDICNASMNIHDSPIYDILRIATIFDMYGTVMNMVNNGYIYTKAQWKRMVWGRAWEIEDADWDFCTIFYNSMEKLRLTVGSTMYMSWWHISDIYQSMIGPCETMAKLVCCASALRSDDYRLKHTSYTTKSCTLCDQAAYECAEHMVMSCPYNDDLREHMFSELSNTDISAGQWSEVTPQDIYKVLLGGKIASIDFTDMIPVWCTAAKWVHKMYIRTLQDRAGIG